MSESDYTDLTLDQLIDWYVKSLDFLETGLKDGVKRLAFWAHRCPEIILFMPMKGGTYIPGINEIQEQARRKGPEPDLKKLVHSDPELLKSFEEMGDFVANQPKAEERIVGCGKEISKRIAVAKWGDHTAADPFIELEHAIKSNLVGDPLYDKIAISRKQARRFQIFRLATQPEVSEASPQAPSNDTPKTAAPAPNPSNVNSLIVGRLPPSRLKAYQQFRIVVQKHPTMFDDLSAAYDHFKEHLHDSGEDGSLVKKATWVDYVQQAMRHPSTTSRPQSSSVRDLPQDRTHD